MLQGSILLSYEPEIKDQPVSICGSIASIFAGSFGQNTSCCLLLLLNHARKLFEQPNYSFSVYSTNFFSLVLESFQPSSSVECICSKATYNMMLRQLRGVWHRLEITMHFNPAGGVMGFVVSQLLCRG